VIGLDLDGNGTNEHALVLDNNVPNQWGEHTGTGALTTGMASGLYSVNAGAWRSAGDAWQTGYDFVQDVDFAASGATFVRAGTSRRDMGPSEVASNGTPASWRGMSGWAPLNSNYVWTGSMDLGNMTVAAGANATYGMFCGNDWVFASNPETVAPPGTPELGTWVLLACTGLLGLFSLGRRRRAA